MTLDTNHLPEGWTKAVVSDLIDFINGCAFKPSDWHTAGDPIVRIQNLNNHEAPFNYHPGPLPAKYRIDTGDLLFAWSGTPGTSFGAHIWQGGKAWLNQHIFKIVLDDELLNKKFVRLAINQNLNDYIHQAHGGAGLAHITKGVFEQSLLLLPPLAEQTRIVAQVEATLARVNAARQELARAHVILKRFRQSVLAAACSGRLTADWREVQTDLEPASILLDRIRQERKARLGAKYREATEPEVAELPEIPDNWEWINVEAISTKVVDGVHKTPQYVEQGIPFVTVRNLTAGPSISFDKLSYITEEDHKAFTARVNPERGDILITKDGTIGVVRAVRTDVEFSIFVSVALIKPVLGKMTDYLEIALCSPAVQKQMIGIGTGLQHLVLRELRADCIPLPSLEEQAEIVDRVNALFKLADAIEKQVEAATARADRLTQAVLAKAFRGELVPTEAELARQEGREYEMAEALLERIRCSRSTAERPKRKAVPQQLAIELS